MAVTTLNVSLPLDSEGFLRRECPYCKRHFKVIIESSEEEDGSELFCPYCGQSADTSSFWTEDQVRYVKEIAGQKVVQPMLEKFAENMEKMSKKSDFIKFEFERPKAKRPVIAPEADDMIKVKPGCCLEEIKIEEDWRDNVYCVVCGNIYEMNVPA